MISFEDADIRVEDFSGITLLGAPAQFAACGFLFFLPLTADVFFLTNQIARFREISANQIARFRRDEILSSESPYNPPSLEVTCTGEIVEAASC